MFLDLGDRVSSQAIATVKMTACHRIGEEVGMMAFQTDATAEELCLLPVRCLGCIACKLLLVSKVWFDQQCWAST